MPLQRAIVAVLENPGLLWDIPYRSHISAEGRALLISLFCNEAWLTPVDDLFETFMRFTAVLGSAPVAGDALARFRYSLRELEGSFVSIQHRRVRFANPGVKDFLSHVITTDRLVPVLLPAVKTGPEVRQLWEYWNSNSQSHSASRTGSELADAWTSACVRALESSSGKSALRLLPTLMGVCEKFDSDECRDVVRDCIDRIRVDYSDDNQIRELNDIFDLLEMATLDSEFAQELGRLLAGSSESILETHASGMDFSPTAELIDHIARYAEDDEHIGNLPADTLHRVLEEIDGTLETLDSVAELDAFAGQLQAALKKHGVARSLPAARIESRREELFTTPENPRPTTLEALVGQERLTDDEIRSQFESLRWRVQ
jgi:hypothetical protein